jgi:hypothetical protein
VEAEGVREGMLGWECNCHCIRLCVLFCRPSGSRRGLGRKCWGGSVTVISILLCGFLLAEWKQEGVRLGMLGWECNCY